MHFDYIDDFIDFVYDSLLKTEATRPIANSSALTTEFSEFNWIVNSTMLTEQC